MGLRSKNFIFRRKNKDGQYLDYQESDTFYVTNPDYQWNEKSVSLPAGGYYGSTTGLHTLSFTLRNFVGRISVQATLASIPTEEDWFNIQFGDKEDYVEITPEQIYDMYNSERVIYAYGSTGTFSKTVIGNFTYLRIVISRDYISTEPTDYQKQSVGKLEEVLINY
ncbi:hypothetical protein XaC1_305 [Xanthomonas phage XaC1]|nr:hypothetical protein XaC1_305 [Xanthomonas phage XaC1]